MSSIDIRSSGKLRHRARWTDPDGTQHAKHFATRNEAVEFLESIDASMASGSYRTPRTGRSPLRTYARWWLAHQHVRPSTLDRTTYIVEKRIIPRFGRIHLETLHPTDIHTWVRELADEGLAPTTIRSYVRVLSSLLRSAQRDRLIEHSPLAGIRLPRDDNHSVVRPLSVDEVLSIANTIPDRYRSLIITMAGLGLRIGEATGLTVDRIDRRTGHVVIDRQLITPNRGHPHFGPVKTRSSNRRLPLSATVLEAIDVHLDTYGPGPDQLIFTTQRGQPIGRTTFAQILRSTTRRLGIDATSHDLRHHCASLLIATGCPVTTVQHFLGHKNASETLDTYAHLWPHDDRQLRNAIDQHFHRAS
jgi:integrase